MLRAIFAVQPILGPAVCCFESLGCEQSCQHPTMKGIIWQNLLLESLWETWKCKGKGKRPTILREVSPTFVAIPKEVWHGGISNPTKEMEHSSTTIWVYTKQKWKGNVCFFPRFGDFPWLSYLFWGENSQKAPNPRHGGPPICPLSRAP